MRPLKFLPLSVVCLGVFVSPAHAACDGPPGVTGQLMYNATHHVFQGCRADGEWVALGGGMEGGGGVNDHLGNHTATQDLQMGAHHITGTGAVTMGSFSGSGAGLTTLNAGNISSGTVATARLGSGTANNTTYLRGDGTWGIIAGDNLGNHTATQNLNAGTYNITGTGAVTMGSFSGSGAGLTTLNAGNLSSGTVAPARLGSGTANNTTYLRGNGTWGAMAGDNLGNHTATQNLNAGSYNITGTGTVTMGSYSGSGAALTTLNAGNISSGTVAPARLGSGTANNTTYLRGDGTWAAMAGDNLGNHTATQNLNMGTYSMSSGDVTMGSFTGSGASLQFLNANNIATGMVATARLGNGTADATTFLQYSFPANVWVKPSIAPICPAGDELISTGSGWACD